MSNALFVLALTILVLQLAAANRMRPATSTETASMYDCLGGNTQGGIMGNNGSTLWLEIDRAFNASGDPVLADSTRSADDIERPVFNKLRLVFETMIAKKFFDCTPSNLQPADYCEGLDNALHAYGKEYARRMCLVGEGPMRKHCTSGQFANFCCLCGRSMTTNGIDWNMMYNNFE